MNTKRKYEDPTIEICCLSTVEDVLGTSAGSGVTQDEILNGNSGADIPWEL